MKKILPILLSLILSLNCYGGVDFDGTDGRAEKTSAAMPGIPFTLYVRARIDSTASQCALMIVDASSTVNWHFIGSNSGNTRISSRDSGTFQDSTGGSINDGGFHSLVGVFTSTTDRKLYLDGNPVADITNTTSVSPSGLDKIAIGRAGDNSPSAYWNGVILEAAIWSVALTAAEITQLHNSGIKGMVYQIQSDTSRGYFPLDDISDGLSINTKIFFDRSGTGNNITGVDTGNQSIAVAEEVLSYP